MIDDSIDIVRRLDYIPGVPSILVRNIDTDLKARLRRRAAEHGHSMEAEVRTILHKELDGPDNRVDLAALAYELFGGAGLGVDLEPHPPVLPRDPPDFSE